MNNWNTRFKKQIFVLVLGVVVFLLILWMPTPEGMTLPAKRLSAVLALMAVWWIGEGTSIAVTALLPLFLFPVLGIMSSKEVAPNYTNHLVFLFLGGFMIALAMEKWNFHKRLALWIILAIGTSLPRILLGFMIATAFLSMWISNTATTMMMLPVAMAVVRQIAVDAVWNEKSGGTIAHQVGESLGLVMMLGLAYSASIGGVGTLIGTAPNIVFAGFYKELFPQFEEITFFHWMLFGFPLVCVFIPLVWVYLYRFISPIPLREIRIGDNNSKIIQEELQDLGKINRAEKVIAAVFFTTAVLWIFRKPINLGSFSLPGWSEWFSRPDWVHDATVAMAMGVLLMVFPLNMGKGLELEGNREFFVLDWDTVESRVPWGILLLFGGGFAIAAGIGKTGLDRWIGEQLGAVTHLPPWTLILIVCLGITFLTELTSNTATTMMILPIIGSVAVSNNLHPLFLMVPATVSASFAFMLPVATPPNAIVYSSGWVSIPKMAKAGLGLNFIGAIFVTGFVLFLVQMIFF